MSDSDQLACAAVIGPDGKLRYVYLDQDGNIVQPPEEAEPDA